MYRVKSETGISRRHLLATGAAFAATAVSGVVGANHAQAASDDLVVVELFTSQGCNSCPPADALLAKLAQQDNVLALSFPVDYWDYLGWTDTLAKPAHTKRQSDYRMSFGLRQIYTPQMVIQGRREGVGSRTRDIEAKISDVHTKGASTAAVNITESPDGYDVRVQPKGDFQGTAGVWLVFFDPVHEVAIKAGENKGKTLRYHNVVRRMMPIGDWNGGAQSFQLPKQAPNGDGEKCAILVQGKGAGPIFAAALMP